MPVVADKQQQRGDGEVLVPPATDRGTGRGIALHRYTILVHDDPDLLERVQRLMRAPGVHLVESRAMQYRETGGSVGSTPEGQLRVSGSVESVTASWCGG